MRFDNSVRIAVGQAMRSETAIPIIGIVDDDKGVRDSTSSLIRSAGYDVAIFESTDVSELRLHEQNGRSRGGYSDAGRRRPGASAALD